MFSGLVIVFAAAGVVMFGSVLNIPLTSINSNFPRQETKWRSGPHWAAWSLSQPGLDCAESPDP